LSAPIIIIDRAWASVPPVQPGETLDLPEISGVVSSVDPSSQTITLSDGTVLSFVDPSTDPQHQG